MKEIITVTHMRESDLKTIESGVDSKELMYRAALGVYNNYEWNGKIGIFCGSGNNAGDGYALATILHENKYDVEVILVTDKFSADGLYYYDLCLKLNIPIYHFKDVVNEYDICVDALLGTGFKGDAKGSVFECIKYLNSLNKSVISIDINSGLNGDNGLTNEAVKSDLTVSIGYLKPGLFLNKAKDYTKEIINVDIGINRLDKAFLLLEKEDVKEFFKPRFNFSNKGTYGYVGIMGGSENYPGALRLASLGQTALYSGCGVSKLIVPSEIYELIFNNVLETTIAKMPSTLGKMVYDEDALNQVLKGLKVLSIGIGWGESEEYKKILEYILRNYEIPVIIDADGINTLAKMDLEILNSSKAKIVLTPHLKEFSRLTNNTIAEISENILKMCQDFVAKYNVTLLLKGPTTIVLDKEISYLVNTGDPGMATAGSGDVLTGIITGLLGYHFEDITKTVAVASYINGYAGEMASNKFGKISMVASDTANMVREVIKELNEN